MVSEMVLPAETNNTPYTCTNGIKTSMPHGPFRLKWQSARHRNPLAASTRPISLLGNYNLIFYKLIEGDFSRIKILSTNRKVMYLCHFMPR